uniref:Disease resistance N-terminal domain-containing protein n=1 Tax=Quercus lobata TaxID=97700 RepID=A0A7N2R3T2_QUELO
MAEKEDRSNVVKLWVKQVLEVAESMEDVLEEYKFCVAQLQDDQPIRFKGLLQKVPHQVKSLKHRQEITKEIQNIKALLCQIKEKNYRYEFKEQGSSSNTKDVTWHDPRLAAHFIGEAEVVGIDDSRDKMTAWLVEGSSKLSTISIVGMAVLARPLLLRKLLTTIE